MINAVQLEVLNKLNHLAPPGPETPDPEKPGTPDPEKPGTPNPEKPEKITEDRAENACGTIYGSTSCNDEFWITRIR